MDVYYLKETGCSWEALAWEIGVSLSTVQWWEKQGGKQVLMTIEI